MILGFNGKTPDTEQAAFVADNATIIGDVKLREGSSVWFGAVLRADFASISIGANSNVQDNVVFHVNSGAPVIVGDNVTIGHGAIVHSAIIEDAVLVGMGSVIMNGARIGAGSIVAAGALVLENSDIAPGSLVAGVPAKLKKTLGSDIYDENLASAKSYLDESRTYAEIQKKALETTAARHDDSEQPQ